MDRYSLVAYANAKQLTLSYSTSFGISSRFFANEIKPHIYAIYGMVRIADEIVDTYKKPDAGKLLDEFEASVFSAIRLGYSTNPILHAFALTSRKYGIDRELIAPFFASMRMDLNRVQYSDNDYKSYIYGSAEVVGLMCLRVFCNGNESQYSRLQEGASALGSAYQKVNFLRDLASDYKELGRLYFPGVSYDEFDDTAKQRVVNDIRKDFQKALPALRQLPASSRRATMMSFVYYTDLLDKLERTPADTIKQKRIRLPSRRKLVLLISTLVRRGGRL